MWINLWNLSDKMELSGMSLLKEFDVFLFGGNKVGLLWELLAFCLSCWQMILFYFYLKRKETGENCVQFFYVEHNYLSIKFHYTCLKLVGEKRTNVQSIYDSHALLFVCVLNVWPEKLPWRSRCVEDLCNIFTEVCCYTRMYSIKNQ